MRFGRTLLLLATTLALGCAGAQKAYHKASNDLGGAAKLFNDYTRWGYVDKAAEFIDGNDREAFTTWRTGLDKTLRFTDVHVGTIDFPQKSNEATVQVTFTFYRNDSLSEQNRTFTEHWIQRDLHWYVKYEPKAWLPD